MRSGAVEFPFPIPLRGLSGRAVGSPAVLLAFMRRLKWRRRVFLFHPTHNKGELTMAASPSFPKSPPPPVFMVPVGPPMLPADFARAIDLVTNYLNIDNRTYPDDIVELGQISARIRNSQNAA
jgi:hypothetical protein